jgi:hypothetical protein
MRETDQKEKAGEKKMRRVNIDRREEEGKRDRREGRRKPSSRE